MGVFLLWAMVSFVNGYMASFINIGIARGAF